MLLINCRRSMAVEWEAGAQVETDDRSNELTTIEFRKDDSAHTVQII